MTFQLDNLKGFLVAKHLHGRAPCRAVGFGRGQKGSRGNVSAYTSRWQKTVMKHDKQCTVDFLFSARALIDPIKVTWQRQFRLLPLTFPSFSKSSPVDHLLVDGAAD